MLLPVQELTWLASAASQGDLHAASSDHADLAGPRSTQGVAQAGSEREFYCVGGAGVRKAVRVIDAQPIRTQVKSVDGLVARTKPSKPESS